MNELLGGHPVLWVLGHEAWHFVLSLSLSLALLLVARYQKRATFLHSVLISGRTNLTSYFVLSVSLALVWHTILDIAPVAYGIRFWW